MNVTKKLVSTLVLSWSKWVYTYNPLKRQIDELTKMVSLDFRNLQDLEKVVIGMNIGQTILANGNESTLMKITPTEIVFHTTIKPNQGFGRHWHPQPEWCHVLKGELVDDLYPELGTFKPGAVYYVEAYKPHCPANPSNTKDCKLKVIFKRNETKT